MEQFSSLMQKQKTNTHYVKELRQRIGDAFTNCNKHIMNFTYHITDTEEPRALGILFLSALFKPAWVKSKLEKYGITVLKYNTLPVRGNDRRNAIKKYPNLSVGKHPLEQILMIVRIPEDEDFA